MWPFKKEKIKIKTAGQINETMRFRHFQAAAINRLTASLTTSSQSMDWELRNSLSILRARSRELSVNNPYASKFLQMVATHVVGPQGFNLKVSASEPTANGEMKVDVEDSKAIENAFWTWAKKGNCEVTGYHSFFDVLVLAIKAIARDGETIIKKVRGSGAGPFGYQLQILDVERLDTNHNLDLGNGNIIKMGVEINQYGRPIAYHVRTAHPGDSPYSTFDGKTYERIPADDIFHLFVAERPEQNRGVPWMSTAILRLNHLGGYEEAAVVAARVGAAKMGFFETPDGDGSPLATGMDENQNFMTEADPGVFGVLPAGYKFNAFNPDYPHAMFAEFIKSCLRGVASALNVSYNTISNDLEGVNFSSIRTGVLEERDNWMCVQNWLIEKFLTDLYSDWLSMALLKGAIKTTKGFALPAYKFDKYNKATWLGRRWQWVDPVKDIDANIKAVDNGIKSRSDVAAEQGRDFEDVLNSIAAENKLMESLGIVINRPGQNPQQNQVVGGAADE